MIRRDRGNGTAEAELAPIAADRQAVPGDKKNAPSFGLDLIRGDQRQRLAGSDDHFGQPSKPLAVAIVDGFADELCEVFHPKDYT